MKLAGLHTHVWIVALAALAVVVVGCGGGAAKSAYETITTGVLEAGQPVAVPAQPIVEIDGKISSRNVGDSLMLDLATFEQLGLIRYSVEDPWLKREISYTGVLLSELVRFVQPGSSVTAIHFVALDDYAVAITIEDAERWPIMVATRLDGERMPVANGGPTRIVFPYGLTSEIDELEYKDLWIWNIKSISFR